MVIFINIERGFPAYSVINIIYFVINYITDPSIWVNRCIAAKAANMKGNK